MDEYDADEMIEMMYKHMNDGCELFLEKKRIFQTTEEKKGKKFIPQNVRKLLRRKMKLSNKLLKSADWKANYKTLEELEEVEIELKESYKSRRLKHKSEVIEKI